MLEEDVSEVAKRLVDWYTGRRHELQRGWNPFAEWYPTQSPAVDMSWLAFGFDRRAVSYSYTYKYYPHIEGSTTSGPNCGCTSCVVAARAVTIIRRMSDTGRDLWDTPLFQVARTCLCLLASGGFPYTPLLAHQWMMCGTFSVQDQWVFPVYDDTEAFYRPCFDLIHSMESLLDALSRSAPPWKFIEDRPIVGGNPALP